MSRHPGHPAIHALLVVCAVLAFATAGCALFQSAVSRGRGITLGVDLPWPAESEIQETMARLVEQRFWVEGSTPLVAPLLRADTFQALAGKASPAVVNIFTSQIVFGKVVSEPSGLFPIRVGVPMPHEGTTLGSGFLINPDGFILTSREVVLAAQSVEVRVAGYAEAFPAKVLGEAPATDVVLLKIEAPAPLPFLPLGDSERIRAGEAVVALGNPRGKPTPTVTSGVVIERGQWKLSETASTGPSDETEILEVDAAIGPANVGGPLLDLQGNAIGINMVPPAPPGAPPPASRTGTAIPIHVAKRSIAIFLAHNPLIQMFGK